MVPLISAPIKSVKLSADGNGTCQKKRLIIFSKNDMFSNFLSVVHMSAAIYLCQLSLLFCDIF